MQTTGLDPVNKRGVWKLIKKLKADRVVIFTTHSMEEAEYLADRIGIMSEGVLMTSGTSVDLRKEYGNGYKLSFVVLPERTEELQHSIEQLLPSAVFVNANAGSVTYTISSSQLPEVAEFFKQIKNDAGLMSSIIDWGIAHSCMYIL